ncbi:MAG: hypothetical protein J7L32_02415 [Thermoplasmata archaeon]|nr:hypothetical protein [Thermoplasmata archaeon]
MPGKDFDDYMKRFEQLAAKYVPPKKDWTPVDEAVYGPKDIYRVPEKKAKELQFKAIKYQFKRQYENNQIYHNFCKEHKVTVDDIKTYDDLEKIPLVPDQFFKDYPVGKEFAFWLGSVFTGELPKVTIKGKNPSFDDVINAFNNAGLYISYSSGTSGRHTFISRDKRTWDIVEYSLGKAAISMAYPIWEYDMYGYLLMPNPFKTNVFAGKGIMVFYDLVKDVRAAINREVNTEVIQLTMGAGGGLKAAIAKAAIARMYKKVVNNIISWLEMNEREKNKIVFVGAPWLLYAVMTKLQEDGRTFDFADRGGVITGGGWKIQEDRRVPVAEFRKMVKDTLGINEEYCLDVYAMVESNGIMAHCQEGHYLHIPHSYYHPLVLDEDFKPKGYGEYGQFAFLDSSTYSYPGFIISGDRVRILEHCPVCDRPGPVLEPEVTRVRGAEMRGCAEEVRRMLSTDLGR